MTLNRLNNESDLIEDYLHKSFDCQLKTNSCCDLKSVIERLVRKFQAGTEAWKLSAFLSLLCFVLNPKSWFSEAAWVNDSGN